MTQSPAGAANLPTGPVDEPLLLSAPFARELSTVSCAPPHGPGCGHYHGFWQFMRLMGLGKTLSGQSALYLSALRQAARERARRPGGAVHVLISGSADYCALAHVLAAFDAESVPVRVTALDMCDTPLLLNRWYARRHGCEVDTVRADVLDHASCDGGVDLIVTSSFLGYFDPRQRLALFQRYRRLLRPDGQLIFANRLRQGDEAVAQGFDAAQLDLFARTAAQRARTLAPSCGLSAEDAGDMAHAYGEHFASYPLNDLDSVQRLARGSDLRVLDARHAGTAPAQGGLQGPTLADGASYLFVVLVPVQPQA